MKYTEHRDFLKSELGFNTQHDNEFFKSFMCKPLKSWGFLKKKNHVHVPVWAIIDNPLSYYSYYKSFQIVCINCKFLND